MRSASFSVPTPVSSSGASRPLALAGRLFVPLEDVVGAAGGDAAHAIRNQNRLHFPEERHEGDITHRLLKQLAMEGRLDAWVDGNGDLVDEGVHPRIAVALEVGPR